MRTPRHLALGLGALVWLAVSGAAQDGKFLRRGLYFVAKEDGVELWIPGWVNCKDRPREGMAGEFGLKAAGLFLQMYMIVNAQTPEEYVANEQKKAPKTFPSAEIEVIPALRGCRNPTAVILYTNIDDVGGYEEKDLIVSATSVQGVKTVCLHIISAKGQRKAVLPVVRSMANSMRLSGEAGLIPLTLPRHLDQKSGLSFRLPNRFRRTAAEGGALVAAMDDALGERLWVVKASPDAVEALKARAKEKESWPWRLLRLPHPDGARILMRFHPPAPEAKTGRAEAVVAFPDGGPVFQVQAEGAVHRRDALLTAIELTAMGLEWIDVEATRRDAAAAAGELETALRRKDPVRVQELLHALTAGVFLPAARRAIEKALPRLDESEQIGVVEALVASEERAVLPALLKLYKASRFKKRLAMRRTVLRSLRDFPDPAALKLLLAEAGAKAPALAATAVYSLGYFAKERKAVLRKLATLYKKEESAGRGSRQKARERWVVLRPAYEATLQRLTGEKLSSARELQDWLRANRAKL